MIPHEDEPEVDPLGEIDPSEVDEVSESLKALETRLTKILKHANTEMGLYAIDLIESLHKVMGRVISWGMVENEDTESAEDSSEDDSEDQSNAEPKDDGVITPDWTPASDLTKDDDDGDVDDQGDPRKPCLV